MWHHEDVKNVAQPPKLNKKATAPKREVATERAVAKKYGVRADLGAPIDGFFAKHPPALRAILDELRKMVEEIAPDATASIKWGMPFYSVAGHPICALAGFKAHVNLILSGPPDTFTNSEGILEGDGKTGRHLKLLSLDDLPRVQVRRWLRSAAERARNQE